MPSGNSGPARVLICWLRPNARCAQLPFRAQRAQKILSATIFVRDSILNTGSACRTAHEAADLDLSGLLEWAGLGTVVPSYRYEILTIQLSLGKDIPCHSFYIRVPVVAA